VRQGFPLRLSYTQCILSTGIGCIHVLHLGLLFVICHTGMDAVKSLMDHRYSNMLPVAETKCSFTVFLCTKHV
jgi:hypothetical protein